HTQNDIFGEMVLALAPIFLDERFAAERSAAALDLLERLGHRAVEIAGTPDAGIWEYRKEWKPQTFSSLMSWAAADRVARILDGQVPARAHEFHAAAEGIRRQILERAWNAELGSSVGSYDGDALDASLLQMAILRFLPPDHPQLASTLTTLWSRLSKDGWLFRYGCDDGLGRPEVAFILCTFWMVE